MDSSHGMLLPLHAAGSCELLPITGALKSDDVQASFRLFCQFSCLILKITKLLTWKRSAHQGVDNWEKASILAIPQKSSRRRNVYKSRKDFPTDQQYTEYVKSVLNHGMRVICIQSYETVRIGDTGKFVKCVDYHPPAVIKWDKLGVTLNFPYTHIGILPTESVAMTCESECLSICMLTSTHQTAEVTVALFTSLYHRPETLWYLTEVVQHATHHQLVGSKPGGRRVTQTLVGATVRSTGPASRQTE